MTEARGPVDFDARPPVLVASGGRVDGGGLRDDLVGVWQQYGELMGMPAERMAATIAEVLGRQPSATSEEDYVRLLREAGLTRVVSICRVLGGGLSAWLAR